MMNWKKGYDLLRARVDRLPAVLLTQASLQIDRLPLTVNHVRSFVTSGVGSSEAHARFLAHLLSSEFELPSRFVPLSTLASSTPNGSEKDVLILFSQGLSPNARLALARPDEWHQVLLATAVTEQKQSESNPDSKQKILNKILEAGGKIFHFQEEDEYTTLLRTIGPMSGYLCALQIARAIAGKSSTPLMEEEVHQICAALRTAECRLDQTLNDRSPHSLVEHPLAFITFGEYSDWAVNLQYKILEGTFARLPPVWDFLHFGHGPFQQAYNHQSTFLALTQKNNPLEQELLKRMKTMLVPEKHTLIELPSILPGILSIFDHEALLNHLVLKIIQAQSIDQINWPGRGQDGPLYNLESYEISTPPTRSRSNISRFNLCTTSERTLDLLTWPELESLLQSGARTAVIPLGATEQHGLHMAFATDTWISDALADRFCARVKDAIRLPTLAFGCSSEHMKFPGTLSLRHSTLLAVLEDLLMSCKQHGFEKAFLFTGHGGNYSILIEAQEALRKCCSPMELKIFTDFEKLSTLFHQASASYAVSPEHSGHHAGEYETSILLGLRKDSVRQDRLEAGFVQSAPEDLNTLFYPDLRVHAPNGTVGDPQSANANRSEHYLDTWVDALVESYKLPPNTAD